MHDAPQILLVEDNAIALRMVELIVTQAGCHFTSTLTGEDGLNLAQSKTFDLIITDIGLPGFSGYEFAARLRAWEVETGKKSTPVVGLTAHAQSVAREQCLEAGMQDVFCKPVDLHMIQTILKEFVPAAKLNENLFKDLAQAELNIELQLNENQYFKLDQFPVLDMDQAAQHLGDKALLIQMLQLMLEQEMPNDIAALQKAYKLKAWNELETIAHRMKGGAVYCGTTKLQYACQYFELSCKAEKGIILDKLYQQLMDVVHETRDVLENFFKKN